LKWNLKEVIKIKKNGKLYILWTSDDKITFKIMISMYALNGKKNNWWDEVEIIIWGSPAKLVAQNSDIQKHIRLLIDNGVKISACKACADELNVTQKLKVLDIEVKYWGEPLTKILKNNENLITL